MKQKLIQILKKPEIFRDGGSYTLRNGSHSNIYIDTKKAYGIPGFKTMVSREMRKIIDCQATCIAGMGLGGIPLASVYGELYNIPVCLIREKSKSHGINSQIEGYIPIKKDKIVIIDDVYTSGSSIRDTIKVLEDLEAEIIQACVILIRNKPNLHFPIKSILKLEDIR